MKRFVLSLVSLLMLMIPLNASSSAKAFGSYFSGLIEDDDYDSRNYPDRLLRLETRKVMLEAESSSHSSYGFDIIPLRGQFLTRHTLSTRINQWIYEYSDINSTRSNNYESKSISIGNYCAFKAGGIPLGIAISGSKSTFKRDENMQSSPLNPVNRSLERDEDSNNNGIGFTFSVIVSVGILIFFVG